MLYIPSLIDYYAQEGEYYHIKLGLKKSVIQKTLICGREGLTEYIFTGDPLVRCIEFQKFYKLYPLSYSPPDYEYIRSMLTVYEDASVICQDIISEYGFEYNKRGIKDYPQRLQMMLNIAIEFYKFTGEIIWSNPFGEEEYRKYFEPWKDEHKKRFEVLMKIIKDYRTEEVAKKRKRKKE